MPTMGALHAGHLALVSQAREIADHVIVSIFVNPTQFNNTEDLAKYPRDINKDAALLSPLGVDCIFNPAAEEIYPSGHRTRVNVLEISADFEGPDRPGHFEGVATVVTKLFNIVQPDIAIFGEKDYQQLCLVQALTADLMLPIKIIPAEIVREPHGLAMSSRNERLAAEDRQRAAVIYQALSSAKQVARSGMPAEEVMSVAGKILSSESDLKISYLALVDQRNLERQKNVDEYSRILLAVIFQGVRLLDNIKI